MGTDARGFPLGDLRVSDAERDRAVSELSEAYQAGRITVEEFDQRSTQALSARTGRELTATVADLPLDPSPVGDAPADKATPQEDDSQLFPWLTAATSLTAICFADVALMGASQPGVGWTGSLTPAAISVLFVVLVIVLRTLARRAARLPELVTRAWLARTTEGRRPLGATARDWAEQRYVPDHGSWALIGGACRCNLHCAASGAGGLCRHRGNGY
jgi:hypothetical protein